jgi:hypothetical protein
MPEVLIETFHKATTTVPHRAEVIEELRTLDDGPTFLEFKTSVRMAPCGRSGGPSGLTYDLLKLLDDRVLQLVHEKLQLLHAQQTVPSLLKKKNMCLLPKEENDLLSADKLRPIMLIECLRKLWLRPIVYRIRKAWQTHNAISPVQYGFLGHRACSDAILQLLNVIEWAQWSKHDVFISSFDIKMAFDSVPREVSEMALIRLGVPQKTAEYLAHIDDDDEIRILTPYAKEHPDADTFTSHIGTGQGDVHSPLIWIAVMDIMLTASRLYETSHIHYPIFGGQVAEVEDKAYADDYISPTATQPGLQRKCDIYTAWPAQ